MRRYELSEGTSNKFWEIELDGSTVTVRFGKIGTKGQEKVTTFGSPAEAQKAHDKLITEKTKKGYSLAGGGEAASVVEPTTSVRAKGRSWDVSGEPAVAVDVAKVETNLGMPVGPVLRELVTLCQSTYPSEPASAFALLGEHGDLGFGIFHHPHNSVGMMGTPNKRLRPFATDHKNVISFVTGVGSTTDDAPVAYQDVIGAEEPAIIAENLAAYLSKLAFDAPASDDPGDAKDIKRLAANLKTHSAVKKKLASAELPEELGEMDLDEEPDADPPAKASAAPGKGMTKAQIEKAKKLMNKADETRWMKSPAAAVPAAQKAYAAFQDLPYAHEDGYERIVAEEKVLDILIEAKQTAEAAKLWEELVSRWTAEGAGGTGWLTLAQAQRKLGATLPADIRDAARKAWARGRFLNVFDFDGTGGPPPPDPPSEYPFYDAHKAVRHGKLDLARTLLAAARAKKPIDGDTYDLFELVIAKAEGADIVPALRDLVARAPSQPSWNGWEAAAALFVLLGIDDAALASAITDAWKKKRGNGETAIFES